MFCMNCGKELLDGAKFCDKCGTKVGDVSHVTKNDEIGYQFNNETKVGEIVKFGKYYNTNNKDLEDLQWVVLDNKNGKVRLLTKDVIDAQQFYKNVEDYKNNIVSKRYEYSNLRRWLNDDFYNIAFNDSEKQILNKIVISNSNVECDYIMDEEVSNAISDYVTTVGEDDINKYYKGCNTKKLYKNLLLNYTPYVKEKLSTSKIPQKELDNSILTRIFSGMAFRCEEYEQYMESKLNKEKKHYDDEEWDFCTNAGMWPYVTNSDLLIMGVRPIIEIVYENYNNSIDEQIKTIEKIKTAKEYGKNVTIDGMQTIKLGKYPIYDKKGEKLDDIEWVILEKSGDKALIISKYIIDYNVEFVRNGNSNCRYEKTWKFSHLRDWLNNDFISKAFNANELERIILTNNKYVSKKGELVNKKYDSEDLCFALSIDEVNKYFNTEEPDYEIKNHRKSYNLENCNAASWLTDYASSRTINGGVSVASEDTYILRELDEDDEILHYGIYGTGRIVNGMGLSFGIRPAMWVKI